jgi:putative IMPACT (imprinted ancient) family translation regulator
MGMIERMNLQNILIVVTRYFGGILLGTGGLVKAYTESAKRGIEDGITIEKVETFKVEIELKYDLKDIVCSFLERNFYDTKAIYFGETVKIIVNVNKAEFDAFYRNIEEITEGRSKVQKI